MRRTEIAYVKYYLNLGTHGKHNEALRVSGDLQ